jgi:hypothetical protein
MIQTRLPGQNLGTQLWKTLNIEQKTCIAQRVTVLTSEIASLQGPAGVISFDTLSQPPTAPISVKTFHTPAYANKPAIKPATTTDALSHLLERCDQWRAYQSSQRFSCPNSWTGFAAIAPYQPAVSYPGHASCLTET